MALVTGVPDRRSRPFRINAVITPAVHDHTHATSYTSSAERFLCSRISSSSTGFAAHHERPGRAGHLVGERDRDDLERSPGQHLCDPGKLPWMKLAAAHHRDRADDKQSSQVAVALLGDRAELGLAAGRHLSWHQPNPGRKVAPGSEDPGVCHRRGNGGCTNLSDARNGLDTLALLARTMLLHNPLLNRPNHRLQSLELRRQHHKACTSIVHSKC